MPQKGQEAALNMRLEYPIGRRREDVWLLATAEMTEDVWAEKDGAVAAVGVDMLGMRYRLRPKEEERNKIVGKKREDQRWA